MSKKKINKPLKPLFNDFAPEEARPAKEPGNHSAQKPAVEETQAARRGRGTSQLDPETVRRVEENALAMTSAVSNHAGAMSLAFRTDENTWATLRVVDEAEPRNWALEEQMLVKQVADQLSLALENARLFQETQRRAEEQTAINQIISSASQVLDIRMMLENVLEQTLVITGFTSGLVSLYNDKEQRLELIAHHNLPRPILENLQINGFQKSVCEYVYLTKESLYIPDLRQGAPIPVAGLIATNILTYFGIPLKVKDQTIGTLCMFGNAPKPMEARLVDLTRSIGAQIGFALENARLFEETRGSQQALTRSEGELRALFSAMNDVIIVYDKDGRYLRIAPTNPSRLFQPPQDMLGKKVEEVLPEQTVHIIMKGIHEALTGTVQTVKLEYPLKIEQKEYWFEGNVSKLNEEQVFLVARDITDRKYNELLQTAITQITEAALSAPDITGLLQIIHENIKTLMPADNFSVSLYDETTDLMTFPYHVDEKNADYHSQKPGQGLTSYVLRTGEALLVTPEVFDDLEKSGEIRAEDTRGVDWVGVPLRSGTQRIGVMAVQTYDPKVRLTEKDRDTLNLLASQVAIAIERKRSEDALKRRNEYLAAASEIGRLVTSTLDLNTIFSRAVNLVRERFGFYHAAIFVVEETGFNAVLREGTGDAGLEMKLRHHSLPVNERSIVGKATQTGEVVVSNNTAADKVHKPNPLLPDTRSEAAIPLHVGVRIIGALDIQSPKVDAFTPDDLSVLQILADQVAIAIDNARSYELSQQAIKEMREIDRMKSMFLANMSHELRTPLNSIIGFSRVILKGIDGPTSELQEQDLTAIYNSGQHLLGLINDILDLSKIEAGKMELAFDEVNVGEVINGVMSTVMGLVRDKQIKLIKNIPDDLPTARADAIRVRQILLNLLSNAAKFTTEGSITVDASVGSGPSRASRNPDQRDRYRPGHRPEGSDKTLPGLLASGRFPDAQDRRQRAGAVHQPAVGPNARRTDRRPEHARKRQHFLFHPARLPYQIGRRGGE
jgi:PAS domain S-box-containing protein